VGVLVALGSAGPADAQRRDPVDRDDFQAEAIEDDGTDVLGAFTDSFRLLLLEHSARIAFQEKTRRELGGPFFSDYARSIRVPGQWGDTDPWWVNYLGHPVHGAAAGYVWLDHDRRASPEFGRNRRYWATRGRAAAWAAAYSIQFEIGPLSEASLGNVGMRPETTGWVDHVITPVGAFGLIVGEDALDRYVVLPVEGRTGNRVWRAVLRLVFNPGRALANTARGRAPWYRPDRSLDWNGDD
jgi:hypothetical protein